MEAIAKFIAAYNRVMVMCFLLAMCLNMFQAHRDEFVATDPTDTAAIVPAHIQHIAHALRLLRVAGLDAPDDDAQVQELAQRLVLASINGGAI